MKVLLVGIDIDDILTIAVQYFNEKQIPAVQIGIDSGTKSFNPAVDAGIDLFFLRQAVRQAETLSKIVLVRDTLWIDVAQQTSVLNTGPVTARIKRAHNLIVMEELLEKDIDYWDLIFFKPITGHGVGRAANALHKLIGQHNRVIVLAEDENEATDEMVEEINSFLGLDDE